MCDHVCSLIGFLQFHDTLISYSNFKVWLAPRSFSSASVPSSFLYSLSNITRHFSEHNIVTGCQHGFLARRSCETQLYLITNRHFQDQSQSFNSLKIQQIPMRKLLQVKFCPPKYYSNLQFTASICC